MRARTSLFLALTAASLSIAGTASANTPIVFPPSSPTDAIGTGKNIDQTFTVVDWDAKNDPSTHLGTAIDSIRGVIKSVNDALPSAPGVSIGLGDPALDADASVRALGRAYVHQRGSLVTSSASMGVHAEATATAFVGMTGYSINTSPSVSFDAAFVKPGLPFCMIGIPCRPQQAPYYHVSFLVRSPTDSSYTTAFDYTQANPLQDYREQLVYATPNIPALDFGVMTVPVDFTPGMFMSATYKLDPTGGNVDLSAEGLATVKASGSKVVYDGVTANISARLGLLEGHGSRMQGATAHARAWLGALTSILGGSLCAGASGSLDADHIGSYNMSASLKGKALNVLDVDVAKSQQGDGFAISKTWTPAPACINF